MSRAQLIATGLVCATAILVTGMITHTDGGSLTPPAGNVASTMVTLDQIYDSLAGPNANPTAGAPTSYASQSLAWSFGSTPFTPIVTGSGTLHTIILGHNTYMELQESDGTPVGCFYTSGIGEQQQFDGSSAKIIPMNIRFSSGLQARAQRLIGASTGSGWTIRYTLDE